MLTKRSAIADTWNSFSDLSPALLLLPYPSNITDTAVLSMQKHTLLCTSWHYQLLLII